MSADKNFIETLRSIDEKLKNLKLSSVKVKKSDMTARFNFINDVATSDEMVLSIKGAIENFVGEDFKVEVSVGKKVATADFIKSEIIDYFKKEKASNPFLASGGEISVEKGENGDFYFALTQDKNSGLVDEETVKEIEKMLDGKFCEKIVGGIAEKEPERNKTESREIYIPQEEIDYSDYEEIRIRTFNVFDLVKVFGEEQSGVAIYAADKDLVNGGANFAGTVLSKAEKTAKSGKPFYVLEIADPTGKIAGTVFYSKDREKKLAKIEEGSVIAVGGIMESFNGRQSFLIKDLAFCSLPQNFTIENRIGKSAPQKYTKIFPRSLDEFEQSNIFDVKKEPPECLLGKDFVVIDIETTGVSYAAGDKITEVGAVKIKDGEITDCFQTLVNPEREISEKITELTGIDGEMVKDAPKFEEIIPDLYKYCDGAIIIAHNLDFDYNFIKFQSKSSGFIFNNEAIDTLAFSKEVLPRLRNHKLNTVCKYFNIEFLHHRALSDAHATAKMFIELAAIKKSLPNQ